MTAMRTRNGRCEFHKRPLTYLKRLGSIYSQLKPIIINAVDIVNTITVVLLLSLSLHCDAEQQEELRLFHQLIQPPITVTPAIPNSAYLHSAKRWNALSTPADAPIAVNISGTKQQDEAIMAPIPVTAERPPNILVVDVLFVSPSLSVTLLTLFVSALTLLMDDIVLLQVNLDFCTKPILIILLIQHFL